MGSEGAAVTDLHRRLSEAGFAVDTSSTDSFCVATELAVRKFQESRGLEEDGMCGKQTWSALAEAAHRLGDRLIYLQSPMLRGDDVAELQQRLGALGFDPGRVDGIFGQDTRDALESFQRNAGLQPDAICGPNSVKSLRQLGGRDRMDTVTEVRERELLRASQREMGECHIVVGEYGGLDGVVATICRALQSQCAQVHGLHHPDESHHAKQCNEIDATVYIGVKLRDEAGVAISYFETEGYVSYGGRHLAHLLADQISGQVDVTCVGRRLPVLRETRMPAVVVRIGPPEALSQQAPALAQAISGALKTWVVEPVPTLDQ